MIHRIGRKKYIIKAMDVESHNDTESIAKNETSIWLGCYLDENSKVDDESSYFYTISEFLERISKINDNIEILSEYINTDSYVKCRCKIDGYEWETRAKQLLDNHGCPLCGGIVPKAHSKFVEEVSDINSDIEICGEYVNAHTKVLCRCKICDTKWYVTPHGLIDKRTGCPSCRNSQGRASLINITSAPCI